MALLGAVMLALLSLYPRSLLREKQLQNRSLAQGHAVALLGLPHDPTLGTYVLPDSVLPDGTVMHATLEISAVVGFAPEELRQLAVTVTWAERGRPLVLTRRVRVGNATY